MWVNVTWGAGGSTAERTMEVCVNAREVGLDVMMHITCENMAKEELRKVLQTCKAYGIRNILALRGDPKKGEEWKQAEGGFANALEMIAYIRREFGDYFCIGCAGYPEGHQDAISKEEEMKYLKRKVDAGADMIITQLFYDTSEFLTFTENCERIGIKVPVLPGIMPIQSYAGFKKATGSFKTKVPSRLMEALEPLKEDADEVKEYGVSD